MGLTYKYFSGSASTTQKTEVLEWLQNNASDYFDTITADENGTISCTISGVLALKFGFTTSNNRLKLYKKSDSETPVYTSSATATTKYFRFGCKTPYGLCIKYMSDGAFMWETLWITRTNNGNVAIVAFIQTDSTSTGGKYIIGDFSQDKYFELYTASSIFDMEKFMYIYNQFFTTIAPIGYGDYNDTVFLPNLYMFRFSQNQQGNPFFKILTLNDIEYFTDSYLALRI
jgi:hypothetical protein